MAIFVAILLISSMGASMILVPNAKAQTVNPTYTFISVSPDPIGVGQTARVNFWVNEPPPTASAQYGDRWQNMTVLVTKPDGTTETLGPFTSDATGGTSTTYTPTVEGNYTFQMFFPGQTLAGANPAPNSFPSPFIGDVFGPSHSDIATLQVTTTPAGYPPVNPLPTNYWTRPIYAENTNWYSIAGNWLGLAASTFAATGMYNATGNYNPYATAPTTGHILWSKPEAFGGIIGGEFGGSETSNYYATSQYEPKFAPIIMQGILYYTMYPGSSTYPEGWQAVNLQTGQVIWTKTEAQVNYEVLKCGEIINMITPNQYGALAYLWSVPIAAAGFMAGGEYMAMYDAMTGNWILNITANTGVVQASLFGYSVNVTGTTTFPAMTLFEDDHGGLCGYYTNTTTIYSAPPGPSNNFQGVIDHVEATLCMWNSTADINLNTSNYAGGPNIADDWMWRPPQGGQIPFLTTSPSVGESSVTVLGTLPTKDTSAGSSSAIGAPGSMSQMGSIFGMSYATYLLGISAVQSGVVYLSGTVSGGFAYSPGWEEVAGFSLATNQIIWGPFNRTETPFSIVYSGGNWAGSGAIVECTQSTLSVSGYSLTTGKQIWGPVALPGARAFDALGANSVVANGTDYIWLYGGDVYAINILTGAVEWHYATPSGGLESPYGTEPLWTFSVGTVAGGILFVPEGHMYSPPLFHGAQQLALNITDGSVVWSELAFDVTSAPAVSDGVATTLNAYDNQIYAWGKGPTQMTVSAPQTSASTGTPIIIRGTIYDVSAGSKQEAVAANFPNGLPCVSDASMSSFMESVYMQEPMPSNITGVPIELSVLDSNGNFYSIGSVTSDATGMFTYSWTPTIPGNFTIYASFTGSGAYYPTAAETSYYATNLAPTPSPAPATVLPPTEMYIVGSTIAIIIAVAIVGLILLRKKP